MAFWAATKPGTKAVKSATEIHQQEQWFTVLIPRPHHWELRSCVPRITQLASTHAMNLP